MFWCSESSNWGTNGTDSITSTADAGGKNWMRNKKKILSGLNVIVLDENVESSAWVYNVAYQGSGVPSENHLQPARYYSFQNLDMLMKIAQAVADL